MDKDDWTFSRSNRAMPSVCAPVTNRSTTLQPEVAIYDAQKTLIGSRQNTTAGGDVSLDFKAKPEAIYYVRVRDYYSSAAGDYTLRVTEAPRATAEPHWSLAAIRRRARSAVSI